MNLFMRALTAAAIVGGPLVGSSASAALITATYDFAAVFTSGPNPLINSSVSLTFDPSIQRGAVTVNSFSSDVLPTNETILARRLSQNYISFGNACVAGERCVSASFHTFFETFKFLANGDADNSPDANPFVTSSDNYLYYKPDPFSQPVRSDSDLVTREPSAVAAAPEPALWATMLVGFGMAGTALRKRRVRVGYAG